MCDNVCSVASEGNNLNRGVFRIANKADALSFIREVGESDFDHQFINFSNFKKLFEPSSDTCE